MNIGVFTGNRAELGLLMPLIDYLNKLSIVDLTLFVGGALLNKKYGNSIEMLEEYNINNRREIKILEPGVNGITTNKAIADGIVNCEREFLKSEIDVLIVYADRYETFAAAVSASHMNIPICHIEGGDITEGGTYDDNIRHAISKIAHLHYPSNDQSAEVLRGLGEESWRIKNVGLLPFAGNYKEGLMNSRELEKSLNIILNREIIIFTMHSISSSITKTKEENDEAFEAIVSLKDKEKTIIITYPNDDNGSNYIIEKIEKVRKERQDIYVVKSLGQRRYYSLLNLGKEGYNVICMGNSSSIVKECIFFNAKGILIGQRQNGRLIGNNVKRVKAKKSAILAELNVVKHQDLEIKLEHNPYYVGNGVEVLVNHLRSSIKNPRIFTKVFEK